MNGIKNVFLVTFIGCLIHSFWALSIGWNNTILDMHGFRQTQTAISTFYLIHGSPWLAYETPVLGVPWSIPFEFPIYQWLVALAVKVFSTPLDQTGRFVSVLFLYLSLIPSYIILNYLNIPRQHRWIFLSLFLASPLYLFWSRTFMIESSALFFGLAYLAAIYSYFSKKTLKYAAFAIIFGMLGSLIKITTFAGFVLAASFLTFFNWRKSYSNVFVALVVPVVGFTLLPYIAIFAWTQFGDFQKLLNPLAADFITSKALNNWNFGTLDQKLSLEVWQLILSRSIHDILGLEGRHKLTRLFPILLLVLLPLLGKRKGLYFTSIVIFLAVFLLFTNLHAVHDYYAYANGIFLITATGFCILGLLERGRAWRILGYWLFTLFLAVQIHTYYSSFYPVAITNNTLIQGTVAAIQKYTSVDDVLLIYGFDWSSELPYYSQRRALMDYRGITPPDEPKMKAALKKLSKYKLGAMVLCRGAKSDTDGKKRLSVAYRFQTDAIYSDSVCEVHLADITTQTVLPSSGRQIGIGF